jgi:DNA polymerase III subunit beta
MKFTVTRTALLSVLSTTGKVISGRNTVPILDYFLFELKGNTLTVTASDLETTLISRLEVQDGTEDATIAVPSKLILDAIKELPEQLLRIEIDEALQMAVKWATGHILIPCASASSYPTIVGTGTDGVYCEIGADVLLSGINKTIFATADDDLRPIMGGIYMGIEQSNITFVATDAHKLVKHSASEDASISSSFVLPRKAANMMRTLLLKEDDFVKMSFDKKNIAFNLKNSTLVCRLIEGNYPNYNAVIPKCNPYKVSVDRAEFLNAIKRVSVCANKATNLVELSIFNNEIIISAKDIDFSYSANETVSCSYEGENITIGFKSTFLVEVLSNLDTANVIIELADCSKAGVFKPVVTEECSTDTLMLLMPMMINAQ